MFEACYPFAAVVGQERAKRALMLCLVNPRIGGVLLSGEKGTAKSTLVRGAAQIAGKEVVNLPLNATEDMLVGSVDFETAVRDGQRRFAGGILECAHGNILYVDEINLLPDSLVSVVSCAASAGENVVEREGISHRHDSSFLLIGTMNPEEGPLSPQLLDRFGLYVEIRGETSLEERVRIVKRRIDYERDPAGFLAGYREETKRLKKTLQEARLIFPKTRAGDGMRILAAEMAGDAGCEGNRAELLLTETALAVAALDGRETVTAKDVEEAAEYVLPHRRRDTAEKRAEKAETGKTRGIPEKRKADKERDGTEKPEAGKRQETTQGNMRGNAQETVQPENAA